MFRVYFALYDWRMLRYYMQCLQQDWVLCVCYFVQGAILTLPDVALRLFLSETLLLSPSQVQLIYAFMLIPWLCKPLYGFISDTFPIFGYRRFPYLLISQLLTAVCWIFLSFVSVIDLDKDTQNNVYYTHYDTKNSLSTNDQISFNGMAILGIIGLYGESLFICISGVIVDSIIVERVQLKELGKERLGQLQSVCTLWRLAGTLIASLFSGLLTDYLQIQQVFLITAILPLVSFFCVCFLDEKPLHEKHDTTEEPLCDNAIETDFTMSYGKKLREQVKLIFSHLFYRSKLWKPALFILVLSATPSSYTAFYYYLYYEIGVTPTQFGIMMFLTTLAGLLGTILYTTCLRKRNIRVVFFVAILLGFVIRCTPELLILGLNDYLNIPGTLFAISDSAIISLISQISLMPLMVLGASICPKGVEGTLYAFLMSLTEVGGIIGDLIGTSFTSALGVTNDDFSNLGLLILICNLCSLLPLLLLPFVPSRLCLSVDSQIGEAEESAEIELEGIVCEQTAAEIEENIIEHGQ